MTNTQTITNDDIVNLFIKVSNLEKVLARIEFSLTLSIIKDNTPSSAQSTRL